MFALLFDDPWLVCSFVSFLVDSIKISWVIALNILDELGFVATFIFIFTA
jgi:hypothetical protein